MKGTRSCFIAVALSAVTTMVQGQSPTGQVPPSISSSRSRPVAPAAGGLTGEERDRRCDDLKTLMDTLKEEPSTPLRRREIADYQRMRDRLQCPTEVAGPAHGRPNWEGTWMIVNGNAYGGEFAGRREATLVLRRGSAGVVARKADELPYKPWRLNCPTGPGGFDAYEGVITVHPGSELARYNAFWTGEEGRKGVPVIACTDLAGTTETLLRAVYSSGDGRHGGEFGVVAREGEAGRFKGEQYEFSGSSSSGIWYGRRGN